MAFGLFGNYKLPSKSDSSDVKEHFYTFLRYVTAVKTVETRSPVT